MHRCLKAMELISGLQESFDLELTSLTHLDTKIKHRNIRSVSPSEYAIHQIKLEILLGECSRRSSTCDLNLVMRLKIDNFFRSQLRDADRVKTNGARRKSYSSRQTEGLGGGNTTNNHFHLLDCS